jgi:hypothetical protein
VYQHGWHCQPVSASIISMAGNASLSVHLSSAWLACRLNQHRGCLILNTPTRQALYTSEFLAAYLTVLTVNGNKCTCTVNQDATLEGLQVRGCAHACACACAPRPTTDAHTLSLSVSLSLSCLTLTLTLSLTNTRARFTIFTIFRSHASRTHLHHHHARITISHPSQITVHVPGLVHPGPPLSREDVTAIQTWGKDNEVDFISLTYTHSAEDVEAAKQIIRDAGLTHTKVMRMMDSAVVCDAPAGCVFGHALRIAPEHYLLVASFCWWGPIGSGLHLNRALGPQIHPPPCEAKQQPRMSGLRTAAEVTRPSCAACTTHIPLLSPHK